MRVIAHALPHQIQLRRRRQQQQQYFSNFSLSSLNMYAI